MGTQLLLGAGRGAPGTPSPYTIVSITNDGNGACLVTTAAAHGLSPTTLISISGTSVGAYNTDHTTKEDTGNPLTFVTDVAYISDATGGTWAIV